MLQSAREIVPLARARAREIMGLRQWAETHCRLAVEQEQEEAAPTDPVAGRRAHLVDV